MSAASFAYDFFISRRGPVAAVAQEVADVLTAEHDRVTVQDYDAVLGGTFPLFIHDALVQARHLIVLHAADYDTNHWTRQEFGHFLAAPDRQQGGRRIIVLRCDASEPRGLLAGLVYGDLHGVADPAARRRIILKAVLGEAPADRFGPRVFGPPTMPRENLLFTGREDLLAALHDALAAETGPTALTQAAVHGLGGVGKTSLARAYVARFGPAYGSVWWIKATDRLAIQTGLAGLAHALDPRLPADLPVDEAADTALRLVAERDGPPFLLVYDNVESPELLDALVPPRGAHVLVTSRAQVWPGAVHELPVPVLAEDAAVEFLQRRAGRDDAAAALALARALGCLPLALDHAGAYVRHAGIGFADYARRIDTLLHRAPPRGVDYPASVAATFELAIATAALECPAAETLLGLLCWFDPDAIPLSLADAGVLAEEQRDDAVTALRGVSLLATAPETACGPAVSVHRLVQAVMRARLGGQADAARNAAVAALDRAYPRGAYRTPAVWPRCRVLLPHVQAVVEHVAAPGSAAAANLLVRADNFLDGSGASAAAEAFSRRALTMREAVLGLEHPDTLASVNNLAACLDAKGDLAAAEPLYRRALAASERVLGPEHPNTLGSVNNLALCLQAKGDLAAAEPLYRRALGARERALGPEHPDTLRSMNNLGFCLQAKGHLAAAEPLFRRALATSERVLGPEHPDTLRSVNNLAGCLYTKGDPEAAEPLFRRALAACERVLGPEHPDTLGSVNNFAFCLQAKGELAAAEPLYRRARAAYERVLGPEHPDTLGSVNNLGVCLRTQGDLAAAEPLLRRALAGAERVLGAQHPDTVLYRDNLAALLRERGA